MSKRTAKNLIVGLDVGTTKVIVLVGEVSAEGHMEVIGIGSHPSNGLKRGVVVNIEATVQSIQRAIEEAELMADCEIHSAYAGIAGSHIRGINSQGMIAIRDKEVLATDVSRVIEAAKAVAIPADQKILHVLPQEYAIDNQQEIREPVGMAGVRLEAKVHIVTGAVSAAQNIAKCMQRCSLVVEDIIPEQLASSYAVLGEDEKELGVCLLDIGGGTTDIAIFIGGSIRHTAVIPIAGDQVTNDIAVALRTPTKSAEAIKIKHGCALPIPLEQNETIDVPGTAARSVRQLSKKILSEVIHARYEELFMLALAELRRSGLEHLMASGIVITGGASQVDGALELAESVFEMPARIGLPQHARIGLPPQMQGLTDMLVCPSYATSVGLLLYGYQQQYEGGSSELTLHNGIRGTWSRVKNWFQGNF